MSASNKNQGEGNREAAQHYNEAAHKFVESGQMEKAKGGAKVSDEEEARLGEAEKAGRSHAKEEDPALKRDYSKPD